MGLTVIGKKYLMLVVGGYDKNIHVYTCLREAQSLAAEKKDAARAGAGFRIIQQTLQVRLGGGDGETFCGVWRPVRGRRGNIFWKTPPATGATGKHWR